MAAARKLTADDLWSFKEMGNIALSPDGSIIDASTIRRLTVDEVDRNQPSWSPDSNEISVLCNLADDRDRSEIADVMHMEARAVDRSSCAR